MSTEQIDFNRWSCGTAAGLSCIERKVSTGRLQSLTHTASFGTTLWIRGSLFTRHCSGNSFHFQI